MGVLHHQLLCDGAGLAGAEGLFCLLLCHSNIRNEGLLHGDGARLGVVVAHLGVDVDLGALGADVGVVNKDAATGYFVLFKGIGDSHLVLRNEPDIAVDAAMVGEVEGHLLLARGVGLVVAVVGFDGDDQIVAHTIGETDGDGQVAALMLLDLLAVDVEGLTAHDGLKVEGDITTGALLGQTEVLAVPGDALIVAATAGLGRHQLHGVGCRDHLPRLVIEVRGLGSGGIA